MTFFIAKIYPRVTSNSLRWQLPIPGPTAYLPGIRNVYVVYVVRGPTATRVPDLFRKAPVAAKDLSTVVAMPEKNPEAMSDAVMPSATSDWPRRTTASPPRPTPHGRRARHSTPRRLRLRPLNKN
jgi:hypothetical protein